ncbi:MAG: hypothetical protein ACI814_000739 [Mariniblastus sp.]|jgi:hypothetical protein
MNHPDNHPSHSEPAIFPSEALITPMIGGSASTLGNAYISTQQPFQIDALDYARLSGKPTARHATLTPEDAEHVESPASSSRLPETSFGELDPYVDPCELNSGSAPSASLPSAELPLLDVSQSLDAIEVFQDALTELESTPIHREQEPANQKPLVEIICADLIQPLPETAPPKPEHTSPENSTAAVTATVPDVSDALLAENAQVAEFAKMNPEQPGSGVPVISTAVPFTHSEGVTEAVYDVRDFADLANQPLAPIPGAFEVDSDLFDFESLNSTTTQPTPLKEPAELVELAAQAIQATPAGLDTPHNDWQATDPIEAYEDTLEEDQVFIAKTGEIIEVNGDEGFDHIDLACFDVSCATFTDNTIKVDNQCGSAFEVRHQGIDFALFADGVKVKLKQTQESKS